MSNGAELIAAERQRQIEAEGYSPERDADYIRGELCDAAVAYILQADDINAAVHIWPWGREFFKPSGDRERDLVKAGALIAAEIDRLAAKGEKR